MIILDDDQDQVPKLPEPIYLVPVNRCSTPTSTSSLPDYDTSEAQQLRKPWLRRPKGRYWKIVVIILIVYTLLTVVIGVPLIVTVRPTSVFSFSCSKGSLRAPEATQFRTADLRNDAMEPSTSQCHCCARPGDC